MNTVVSIIWVFTVATTLDYTMLALLIATAQPVIWYGTGLRVPPEIVRECAKLTHEDPWNPATDLADLKLYDCYSQGMGFYD